ncbi:hypothetical protein ACWEQ2_39970 [Streptomyces sp. NPDC004096]
MFRLNDIDIRTVLNPLNKPKDSAPTIARHCHDDLRTLPAATAKRFPNARIVATAYYPMFSDTSDTSDTSGLSAILVAAGTHCRRLAGRSLAPWLIPQVITNCKPRQGEPGRLPSWGMAPFPTTVPCATSGGGLHETAHAHSASHNELQ